MIDRFKRWPYIAAVIFFTAMCAAIFAQPSPRPLPPEFFKRRDAGAAFALGRHYLRQQKPDSVRNSIERFETSERLYSEMDDRANAACARLAIGAAYAELDQTANAAVSFERAIAMLRLIDKPDETALVKLGFLYDHLVGERFLFKYDQLSVERPRPGYDSKGDLVDPRFSRFSERENIQFFNQPFVVYIESERESVLDDPRLAGSADKPKAVSFYADVASIWQKNGLASLAIGTDISLMDSWVEKDARIAAFYGKRAVNRYQELRRTLRNEKPYDPRGYFNQLAAKYRTLADLLISLGRFAEADDVLRMLKEEEYSDFVRRDPTEIERLKRTVRLNAAERKLIDRYLAIAQNAAETSEKLRELDDKKAKEKTLSQAEDRRQRQLAAQAADVNAAFRLFLEKELINEIGGENAKNIAADIELQQTIRDWGKGTVALATVVTENRYRVVLTTPTVQIDAKTEISAENLNKKIFAFRKALQDTAVDPRPLGKDLYDILIKPIEKDLAVLGAETLVWSLDGTLRYIPIAALSPDGKTYLGELFQNVTITSRTREHLTNGDRPWRALGMGVSTEQLVIFPDLPGQKVRIDALPGAREELTSIVRDPDIAGETGMIEGKRFLDVDFSVKNLTASLNNRQSSGRARFNVVHFASHFRLGPDWSSSALVLGGGSLLSLKDISSTTAINFQDVELVTLSACNTALTTSSNGIEVDSLSEAIQAKSGKAVLATLWSVYDESTSSLMKDFYRIKTADPGLTKAAALQQAQKKMIADAKFSHPYFWSPFTLIGNWR